MHRLLAGWLAGLGVVFFPSVAIGGGPGTTAADFLRSAVGPRAVGLGESFAGLADDVNAAAYNPAGLSFLRRQEMTMAHSELLAGVRQEWLAYARPSSGRGTFGVAANLMFVEPFAAFDSLDRPAGATSAQDAAYQLLYAYPYQRAFRPWRFGQASSFALGRPDGHGPRLRRRPAMAAGGVDFAGRGLAARGAADPVRRRGVCDSSDGKAGRRA